MMKYIHCTRHILLILCVINDLIVNTKDQIVFYFLFLRVNKSRFSANIQGSFIFLADLKDNEL